MSHVSFMPQARWDCSVAQPNIDKDNISKNEI